MAGVGVFHQVTRPVAVAPLSDSATIVARPGVATPGRPVRRQPSPAESRPVGNSRPRAHVATPGRSDVGRWWHPLPDRGWAATSRHRADATSARERGTCEWRDTGAEIGWSRSLLGGTCRIAAATSRVVTSGAPGICRSPLLTSGHKLRSERIRAKLRWEMGAEREDLDR